MNHLPEIAKEENLLYIKNIKTKGLCNWVQQSGLTLEELAWMQPNYVATNNSKALGNGVNGKVNTIIKGESPMSIYVGGKFTLADSSIPCKSVIEITIAENEYSFKAIGQTIEGEVNVLYKNKDFLYAGGEFTALNNSEIQNIAKWNGIEWLPMGKLNGKVYSISQYNNEIYAGG